MVGLAGVVACCGLGVVSFAVALENVVRHSETAVGTVTDVYLTLVVGALLVLLATLVRQGQRGHLQASETPDTADASPDGRALRSPALAPVDMNAMFGALPDDDLPQAPVGRQPGHDRFAEEMCAAYKRAAERHSADAALQRQRAEAAEVGMRALELRLADHHAGSREASRRPRVLATEASSHRRLIRFTQACDRVIRGLRDEDVPISEARSCGPDVSSESDRRLPALAASCERQRIQELIRRVGSEYARTLPPDGARLAREQVDHFLHAIEELAIADSVEMAQERAEASVVRGAAD